MATYQTTYGSAPAKGLPGQIANAEVSNRISREVETVAGIAFGQPAFRGAGDHGVIAGAAFAATAVGAADASNGGAATISAAPAVTSAAKQGVYKVVHTSAGATAAFNVYDPDGLFVGNGVTGTEFVGGGLTFTVTDAAGDPVVGDSYTVTVTYTANADFVGFAILNPAVPPADGDASPDLYPRYFTGAFMTIGQMYVTAGGTVTDGAAVYWDPADGRYTAETGILIPDCYFDTSGADGDIVEISLKLR